MPSENQSSPRTSTVGETLRTLAPVADALDDAETEVVEVEVTPNAAGDESVGTIALELTAADVHSDGSKLAVRSAQRNGNGRLRIEFDVRREAAGVDDEAGAGETGLVEADGGDGASTAGDTDVEATSDDGKADPDVESMAHAEADVESRSDAEVDPDGADDLAADGDDETDAEEPDETDAEEADATDAEEADATDAEAPDEVEADGTDDADTDRTDDSPSDSDRVDESEVPAYRDPERLAVAYEENETFEEMTEALDVDVTPQTVRRHMIDHGIHEPHSRMSSHISADDDDSDAPTGESQDSGEDPDDAGHEGVDDAGDEAGDEEADYEAEEPEEPPTTSGDDQPTDDVAMGDGSGEMPDAEQLADELDADLPSDVTLPELVAAVRDAKTMYDVQRALGWERSRTREVLQEWGLIGFVQRRINREPTSPSEDELLGHLTEAIYDAPGSSSTEIA